MDNLLGVSLDGSRKIGRVEPERSGLALVVDATASLDQVEAVRPPGIGTFNPVVEAIDDGRELDSQPAYTSAGYRCPLLLIARTPEKHLVANIALHLPDVGRVCFENIDCVKINLALVLLGELVQGGNLPPERRSRVTPEHQHDWLV
jgi:hypothetical protein